MNEIYVHRFTKGIFIKLLQETKRGYKVEQTEKYKPWTDKKLRTPKIKIAFYSSEEIKELFRIIKA